MDIVLLIARLLLAMVFVVAGLAKLVDLAGSRQAMRDFGVPAPLAAPLGLLLPLAELAVGIALVPTVVAWWAALGALALLVLFVAAIGFNLAHGRKPDCHCFGQLHSAPAGWPTLLRNLLLAAIAGFILVFGRTNVGLDALSWLTALAPTQRIELIVGVIIVALLAIEGWVLVQVLHQQGRVLLRLEAMETRSIANGAMAENAAPPSVGLPVGAVAPAFSLPGLYGETITLDFLRASGKSLLLIFSDPGCGPCTALLPEIGRWQRDYAGKLMVALVSRGTVEANRAKVSEHGITHVLLQHDREVAEAYQVQGTPGAVLVDPDGTIHSPLAQGAEEIRPLVAGAVGLPVLRSLPMAASAKGNGHAAEPSQPAVSQIGDAAPALTLPDLTGKMINLKDFRGRSTLLLFWNPGCGFCEQMLTDLKAWDAQPPAGAPQLFVVSTGGVEVNQAMGLRSTVVLDQSFTAGSRFGANGTPMAVLVDAQGKIASELAAGATSVFALASLKEAA